MKFGEGSAFFRKSLSPTERTLRAVFDRCPSTLFLETAQELFFRTKPAGPPFDPVHYANALGIKVLEKEDLGLDGVLRYDAKRDEFQIELKSDVSASRKKFTLAHEVAHTFFYRDLEEFGERFRGKLDYDNKEEALCNLAAAELLMPSSVFRSDLARFSEAGNVVAPRTIMSLRDQYQVSLQAACIKVARMRKNLVFVLWRNGEGTSVRADWIVPSYFKPLILCHTRRSSVERAMDSPGATITSVDCFSISSERRVRETWSLGLKRGVVLSVLQPSFRRRKKHNFAKEESQKNQKGQLTFAW